MVNEINTAIYEDIAFSFLDDNHRNFSNLADGLLEEAHEVTEAESKNEKLDELSDLLWYVTVMARQEGTSLKQLMLKNIVKLEDRKLNGK